MKNIITYTGALLMAAALCLGCSCITKPKYGSMTGSVMLVNDSGDPGLDPMDFAGITVALYEPAVLDTAITRINGECPQIGVIICQETEFDHRYQTPVLTTVTLADGSYQFAEIDPGLYNLVIYKEGWGIRHRYRLDVKEDSNEAVPQIELYPAQDLPTSVVEDFTLLSDHTYFIASETLFIGSVAIEPRARIYVSPGGSAKFYGQVSTQPAPDMTDAWSVFTSTGLYSCSPVQLGSDTYYSTVYFHQPQVSVSNGNFRHVGNSIGSASEHTSFEKLIISRCGGGISITQGIANLSNLLINNGSNYGISINSSHPGESSISGCILKNLNRGVVLTVQGSYRIENCYISQISDEAIRSLLCLGSITHNTFEGNKYDIYARDVSGIPHYLDISHNNFILSLLCGITATRLDYMHNNNFYRTNGYFITIRGAMPPNYSLVGQDFDATQNYWAVDDVGQYLLDAEDNGEVPNTPCAHYIDYLPRRNIPVPDAGIQ